MIANESLEAATDGSRIIIILEVITEIEALVITSELSFESVDIFGLPN